MNDALTHFNAPIQGVMRAMATAAEIRAQVNTVQEVMKAVMKDGTHYGVIPGTPKPSLWKPGAEVLCATFRIAQRYHVEDLSTADVVRYRVRCEGVHQGTGIVMGEGLGEASSGEEKYKWRKSGSRAEFDAAPADRKRIKHGYSRTDGEYQIRQVRTEPADVANTILKMAAKRAQVAMTLNVTAASDIFTQDIEDLSPELQREFGGGDEPAPREPVRAKSESKPKEAPKDVDPATGEVTKPQADSSGPSPTAPASMARIIAAKMGALGITSDDDRADFFAKHGVVSLETMTIAQGNAILASFSS
jgi:hypothetical protein